MESWEPSQHLLLSRGKPRKTCRDQEKPVTCPRKIIFVTFVSKYANLFSFLSVAIFSATPLQVSMNNPTLVHSQRPAHCWGKASKRGHSWLWTCASVRRQSRLFHVNKIVSKFRGLFVSMERDQATDRSAPHPLALLSQNFYSAIQTHRLASIATSKL